MIELNKVGIEIDGKVYQFRKMSFGFQRRMLEMQTAISEMNKKLAKKYNVPVEEVESKMSDEERIELAKLSLSIQEVVASLFVNKEEAVILDDFDADSLTQLITALQ